MAVVMPAITTSASRVLPKLLGEGLMPSGVTSRAQLRNSARGNPRTNSRMNARSVHSGAAKAGSAIDAAWIAIEDATTYPIATDHLALLEFVQK
jgi:hypothetical protein